MNSNIDFAYETQEEANDSCFINKSIGQQSPKIKPKLDDTIPSLLDLSSDISISKKTSKDDSFNLDSSIGKNLISNKIISLFNKSLIFVPKHYKAFSNEVFGFPKIFNNLEENKEDEKNNEDSNYCNEINFGEKYFCKRINQTEIEEVKSNILIENINKIEEDDETDGLYILNMLRKGKNKN